MTDKYYREEYQYLIEAGREFAQRYPDVGSMLRMLEGRSRDPNIDLLLQGFAFLTSRVRKRLDDDFPLLADGLMSMLWPDFMRPVPSMCMLEFQVPGRDIVQPVVVPARTELDSVPLGNGLRCRFRTAFDATVIPAQLTEITATPRGASSDLTLAFEINPGIDPSLLAGHSLRLQLAGELSSTWQLYEMLAGYEGSQRILESAQVVPIGAAGPARPIALPASSIRPVGFTRDEALLPVSGASFWGFGILREYFVFPEKFHAFSADVLGALARLKGITGFELTLRLRRQWPASLRLSARDIRINCVPAVNLFARDAEPLRLDRLHNEYKLIADIANQDFYRVYSVDAVEGIESGTGVRRSYQPMYAMRHQIDGDSDQSRGPFYVLSRQSSPWGGWDVLLSPVDAGGQPDLPAEEVLSIDLTCTNGEYAASVGIGQLTNATSQLPGGLRTVNIGQPTRTFWPSLQSGGLWRLLAHASFSFVSIGSIGQLRSMLELYNLAQSPDNERRLSGIRGVSVAPSHAMLRGALVPGSIVELLIDEERFPDSGDVHVFARVMSAFLEAYAPINSHSQLAVQFERANTRFVLPPAFGQRETI